MSGKNTRTARCASAARALLPAAALVSALAAGLWLVVDGARGTAPPRPSAAQAFPRPTAGHDTAPAPTAAPGPGPDPAPDPSSEPAPVVRPLPPADPVRLRIPAIGVDAPVTRLQLGPGGALRPPPADDPAPVGWYADGTSPGAVGTAVAVGHLDTRTGPAVFFGLGALTRGATVEVDRGDGHTAVFTVDAVEEYGKDSFPAQKVYADSDTPELRLITCGGSYTRSAGYSDNVVVYATLTSTT